MSECVKVLCAYVDELWAFDDIDFDSRAEEVGAIPYSEHLYRGVSIVALRLASYATRRPFKVVCVDCDNTLWKGVVGEDGPESLQPNLALQRALKHASRRGLMLVTCSKNSRADVQAAFDAHPDWPLA